MTHTDSTWSAACAIEPKLRDLERLAKRTAEAGVEASSWPYFRKELKRLVGAGARRHELRDVIWQRAAHRHIRAILGDAQCAYVEQLESLVQDLYRALNYDGRALRKALQVVARELGEPKA